MKILIVARFKENGYAPFVTEQAAALEKAGVKCVFFPMHGNGISGYIKQLPELRRIIRRENPDVLHAHFVFSGLFANLQRRIPVVTTYHGSDINERHLLPLSRLVMTLSSWNIFVSGQIIDVAHPKRRYSLLPCGIDLDDLQLTDKAYARNKLCLSNDKKYVLFASAFDRPVKNAALAKMVMENLSMGNAELLELKGYSHEEVILLMCAVDTLLMTSLNEGSPQVIKEAMACGCPIVSVDVGDIRERMNGIEGCYVADSFDVQELAQLVCKAVSSPGKTKGREAIIRDGLDNESIAQKLLCIYRQLI